MFTLRENEARESVEAAARAMRAISTLDLLRDQNAAAMARMHTEITSAVERVGQRPREQPPETEAESDARARSEEAIRQTHEIRRVLAELIADAEAAHPIGAVDVGAQPIPQPPLPPESVQLHPLQLPQVMMSIERWYGQTFGALTRELKTSLAGLRRRFARREEEEFQMLVSAIDQVLLRI